MVWTNINIKATMRNEHFIETFLTHAAMGMYVCTYYTQVT